ncbi:MAG: hypothetical protein KIS94_02355 [Chitinophagales bacterium]|nr:hypothetical protein [Chitinophagales bacterium]
MKKFITVCCVNYLCIICFAQWITYPLPIPNVDVNAIAIDAQGNKWCATWKGVAKFNGSSWTSFDTSNSNLASNVVNSVAVIGSEIWFATSKGVSIFNGISWTTYNTANSGLINDDVTTITADKHGNKWLGTGNGISKFNGVNWVTYDTALTGFPNRRSRQWQ